MLPLKFLPPLFIQSSVEFQPVWPLSWKHKQSRSRRTTLQRNPVTYSASRHIVMVMHKSDVERKTSHCFKSFPWLFAFRHPHRGEKNVSGSPLPLRCWTQCVLQTKQRSLFRVAEEKTLQITIVILLPPLTNPQLKELYLQANDVIWWIQKTL